MNTIARRYRALRLQTEALAESLSEADCQVQSMPDASPVKWHLAHTTWFFETFVLERHERGFRPHHPAFRVLFNSYYQGIGEQHPRPQRGLVTRPGLAEVRDYRHAVDERMARLLALPPDDELAAVVELGLQHEQQHQELILTDLRHLLSCSPLDPVYRAPVEADAAAAAVPLRWIGHDGGHAEIGHRGVGFAFDNECPRHPVWLQPFAIANRLVSEGEWTDFIADGGYGDPRWWLSAGWDWVRQQQVSAPLYWRREAGGGFSVFTLRGRRPMQPQAPVVNLSLFEADAYARWFGARRADGATVRLPTEAEWEQAVQLATPPAAGDAFLDGGALHPPPPRGRHDGLLQAHGAAWQWTASAYAAYPGFRPWRGAVGEYNGKFMVNQYVLRGSSCATPRSHARDSYRNFFPADARWQFSGLRLARDLAP